MLIKFALQKYYPITAQIPLKCHFEGKCTPVFSITLEFMHEQNKILLKKICFDDAEIPI